MLHQFTPVCTTSLGITVNKRSILLRRAHSHFAVNLIDGYKRLICSTEVLVVQLQNVPFWTTPQWQTSDFAFLHLLLYRLGTERHSTIISDQVCNCPSSFPFSSACTTVTHLKAMLYSFVFSRAAIRRICIAVVVEQMIFISFAGADVMPLSADM